MNENLLKDNIVEQAIGGIDGPETPRYRVGSRVTDYRGIHYEVVEVLGANPPCYWCKACEVPDEWKNWRKIGEIACFHDKDLTGGWQ